MEKVELVEEKQELKIELVQNPIINYNDIDSISSRVKARIEALDLANLEITEENLEEVKAMNAILTAEFNDHEEKRAYIRDMVEEPYKKFKEKYDAGIKNVFNEAQSKIKKSIDDFNLGLAKKYFDEKNEFEFVDLSDVGLTLKVNSSQKSIKSKIDDYLNQIKSDIDIIKNLENKDRVLSKYQITKDLNHSISTVTKELELEEENRRKQAEQETIVQENLFTNSVRYPNTTPVEAPKEYSNEPKLKVTFTAIGTKEQLRKLKQFMKDEGIDYE